MLSHIHNFPQLCRQAWEMALNFRLPADYSQVKKIVILGMGGSAIGGDLVSSLGAGKSRVPILVSREYDLPHHVDGETLVIASSYSGQTEETLSAFQQALEGPAKKLAITTGGKLKTMCDKQGIPVFTFNYPAQPRAALPFSFFSILAFLENLGILPAGPDDIDETLSNLDTLSININETVPSEQNPAKILAQKLKERLVVIYGAGITAEVAHRWKTQINENSKTMAFYEVFSELNHNAIVGYALPEELTHQTMVVMLDSSHLHERIRLRYQITQQLLNQAGIYFDVIKGEGQSALSQMMGLVLFGDYVSHYLAMLYQVDPTVIKPIDFLKSSLAKR
jgi:glucose/mannose-6-phosphate isomerase